MSNTPSEELMPCPFCGCKAVASINKDESLWSHDVVDWTRVHCTNDECNAQTEATCEGYEPSAIEVWNRRTPQPVNLGFTIENRAGIDVLVWKDGGCQPATSAEVAMWKSLAAAQQPVVREPLTCEWSHNDDDGYWDTSCGKAWRFDDGGPKENNMNFCHCCGKTLRIKGGQHGTE